MFLLAVLNRSASIVLDYGAEQPKSAANNDQRWAGVAG